jgi:hypothetical protein
MSGLQPESDRTADIAGSPKRANRRHQSLETQSHMVELSGDKLKTQMVSRHYSGTLRPTYGNFSPYAGTAFRVTLPLNQAQ